jgi:hypothetical protein
MHILGFRISSNTRRNRTIFHDGKVASTQRSVLFWKNFTRLHPPRHRTKSVFVLAYTPKLHRTISLDLIKQGCLSLVMLIETVCVRMSVAERHALIPSNS